MLSVEEIACEKHFVENTQRNENGPFIVKLRFKLDVAKLGESYEYAKQQFLSRDLLYAPSWRILR